MRIKDNEDKKSKIENDLQLVREEKNDLESSLKAATGKIQQNDKGMDFMDHEVKLVVKTSTTVKVIYNNKKIKNGKSCTMD